MPSRTAHRFARSAARAIFCALGMLAVAVSAQAQSKRPLLFEDTKTIYQRVLTTPGQFLFDGPSGAKLDPLWPLQPVYVFDRRDGWLQVGRDTTAPDGWIDAASTVPWVHNIVGAFRQRGTARQRQLVFETEDKMQSLIDHEAYRDLAASYREDAASGSNPPDSGILSIEPENFADINNNEQFYLMPITAFRERRIGPRQSKTLYLQVAAVPLNQTIQGLTPKEIKTAVVFVIDTTRSMEPFIPDTLATVEQIVADLRARDDEDAISFGLFGFRDNPEGRPGTEYRTREYVKLDADAPQQAILDGLAGMKVMGPGTSTWGFAEDSIAGVRHALTATDWKTPAADFAGRVIVLITDAPAKHPDDPNAESKHTPETVRLFADEEGVSIVTVHLNSRSGADYNDIAAEQYQALSGYKDIRARYYHAVDATDRSKFRSRLRGIVGKLVSQIADDPDKLPVDDEEVDFNSLGKAMRLAYLGRQQGTTVPPILSGWTLDRSFERIKQKAVEARVLMTRNDLRSMAEKMQQIVDTANDAIRAGDQSLFFEDVRKIVSAAASDGRRLGNVDADNLGGLIAEFLEYMPYVTNRLLYRTTEDQWRNDPGLRIEVKLHLEAKIELYGDILTNDSRWNKMYDRQLDSEYVTAIPLEDLP